MLLKLRKWQFAVVLGLSTLCGGYAQAMSVNVSGTYNPSGYGIVGFSLTQTSTVDFLFTGGYANPTFSLFDTSGTLGGMHLVTNDDADGGLYSHLTQTLGAGSYNLFVGYCCMSVNSAIDAGATSTTTDGFNTGTYWFGGTRSLEDMEAQYDIVALMLDMLHAAGQPNPPGIFDVPAGEPWQVQITDFSNGEIALVPEPATIMLFVVALVGLASMRIGRVSHRPAAGV